MKYLIPKSKIQHKNGVAKWCIGNWSNDLEKWEQVLAFKDVFRFFEYLNYPLQYPSTSNIKEAYFKIYFVNSLGSIIDDKGNFMFKCPEPMEDETLAFAYAPSGSEYDGHIYINDNYFWSLTIGENKRELISTLIHEVAHSFNLAHINDKKDLMNAVEHDKQTWSNKAARRLHKLYKDDKLTNSTKYAVALFKNLISKQSDILNQWQLSETETAQIKAELSELIEFQKTYMQLRSEVLNYVVDKINKEREV